MSQSDVTGSGAQPSLGEDDTIDTHLAAGRKAMSAVADYDQAAVDDLARAVAWGVLREDRCVDLVATYDQETGMGTQAGTRAKLEGLIRQGLGEILGEPSVGKLDTDRPGVVEVAKPVGVVGALIPSTNPASTAAFLAMMAVKGRNAIVLSPPPTAVETTERAVEYIRDELARTDAPRDLVQMVERPVTREKAHTLLEEADFAHVTGSARNVEAGETSGTPNYCVGAGNATAVVDETADVDAAAAAIAEGASFDNGAVCTSESNVVADEQVVEDLLAALRDQGGYVCSPDESGAVADRLFEDGHRTRQHLAASAADIASEAGLAVEDPTVLVLQADSLTERFAGEKLAPVVTVHTARGFDRLIGTANRILAVDGTGHSCTLHTSHEGHIEEFAEEVDVCRAVVNQPGGLGLPGAGNGLDATLSLGAGVWGGNQLDENLTHRHFITTTRIARPVEEESDTDLFAGYDTSQGGV